MLNEGYRESFLQSLLELRSEGTLCDVTLCVAGAEFRAHRSVLAGGSGYFKSLFTCRMRERRCENVQLENVNSQVVEDLIKYIYTGYVEITPDTVKDLLVAADYLAVPSLKSMTAAFLESSLNAGNCISIRDFADKFHCDALKQVADEFLNRNFVAVSKSEEFTLLQFEAVREIFARDELHVAKEEQVYEAVIRWVKYKLDERENFFEELFGFVRLFSIPKFYLRDSIIPEQLVKNSLKSTTSLMQGLNFALFPDTAVETYHKPRKSLEHEITAVVLVGGHGSRDRRDKVNAFDPISGTWVDLPPMAMGRSRHAAAVCEGFLYTLGGAVVNGNNELGNTLDRFNHNTNQWEQLGNLPRFRIFLHCAAVAFQEQIYLIGGDTDAPSSTNHRSWVFKYDPKTKVWSTVTPMNFQYAGHCAVVLNNFIYVIGGKPREFMQSSNRVERYDPQSDRWTRVVDMRCQRSFAAAAVIDGKILVAGGFGGTGHRALSSCEIYDPGMNQWNAIAPLSYRRAGACAVAYNEKMYLMGGECDSSDQALAVECYDVQSNVWSIVGRIPRPAILAQACLLRIKKNG